MNNIILYFITILIFAHDFNRDLIVIRFVMLGDNFNQHTNKIVVNSILSLLFSYSFN